MEIIHIEDQEVQFNSAIALGNFDGVHIGHQELIEIVRSKAKDNNLKASMLVFENHTKSLIFGNGPRLITNNQQKIDILTSLGIEILYTMKFDERVMTLSTMDFFYEILINKLN